MKKLLTVFLGVLLSFIFLSPQTVAADSTQSDFSTSYNVTYTVNKEGQTSVQDNIILKNLTSQYYASSFTLTIGSTTLSEVTASNALGSLPVKITKGQKTTSLTITFNDQVAGIDKERNFTLNFKSEDFAQNIGKTWEVNLPKMPSASNTDQYNMTLSVPVSFGEPTSISPKPLTENQSTNRIIFTFNQTQLKETGVSVNFGLNQTYNFVMGYNLTNNSLFPIVTSVTLPPDTEYQDVLVDTLDPKPLNVTVDNDGNILAWYKLPRNSKLHVSVVGEAKLYIHPKNKTIPKLTPDQIAQLTKPDKYWETNNPLIQSTLKNIFKNGKPKDRTAVVRAIYMFDVNTLKYDTNRLNTTNVQRLGAVTALNNPDSAVCMEFTDVFIALTRAAGIPARELDGYAYTKNQQLRPLSLNGDLLHAWPEYYDPQRGWVMVDPTWQNTSGGVDYFNKFDLNHFVMAIKGYSSQTPYITDNVHVSISQTDFTPNPKLSVDIETPSDIWSGFPNEVNVKVSNIGQSLEPKTSMTIQTNPSAISGASALDIGPIPPYGYAQYKFKLQTPNVWKSVQDTVSVIINGQKYTKIVTVQPFLYFQPFPYILLALVIFVVVIYLLVLAYHIRRTKRGKRKKKT